MKARASSGCGPFFTRAMPDGIAITPSLGEAMSTAAPCRLRSAAYEESAPPIIHASPCSSRLKACGICVYTVSRFGLSARSFLNAASAWYWASFIGLPVSRWAATKNIDNPSVFCSDGTITLPLYFGSHSSVHDAGSEVQGQGDRAVAAEHRG